MLPGIMAARLGGGHKKQLMDERKWKEVGGNCSEGERSAGEGELCLKQTRGSWPLQEAPVP